MFLALCFGVLVLGLYSKSFGVLVLGLYSKSFEKFFIWESGLRRWANENDSHSVYVKSCNIVPASVLYLMSYVLCLMSYVLCLMSYIRHKTGLSRGFP